MRARRRRAQLRKSQWGELRNPAGLRPALFHSHFFSGLLSCSPSSLSRRNSKGSLLHLLTKPDSYRRTSAQSVTRWIDNFARQACLHHQTTQSRSGRRKMILKTIEGGNRQGIVRQPVNERSRLQQGKLLSRPSCLVHQLRRLCFVNSIIANGSAHLILEQNGSREVLVLTKAGHYDDLRLSHQGKGLPANYETFVSCEALP